MSEKQHIFKYQIDHARKRLKEATSRKVGELREAFQKETKALGHPDEKEIIWGMLEQFTQGLYPVIKARVLRAIANEKEVLARPGYYRNRSIRLIDVTQIQDDARKQLAAQFKKECRIEDRYRTREKLLLADAESVEDTLVLGEASEAMRLVEDFVQRVY